MPNKSIPVATPTPKSSNSSISPPRPPAPRPILLACNATRFHTLCVSTLTSPSNAQSPSPISLLSTSFSASLSSLPSAISTAKSILSVSSNNPNRSNAATNCIEFLTMSSNRLTTASKLISLSSPPLPTIRIFSSAALSYQYDCWSAYKYVNDSSTVVDAMAYLENKVTALTRNTLSMLAALQRYGNDTSLWGPPQTERDGYWPKPATVNTNGSGIGGVPTGLKPTVTVCKTGKCNFDTVQKAVDAAPVNGKNRYVVYIKLGVYEETVRIPYEKTNVVFVGDGMGKTVITGSLHADTVGVSTYNTATVGVLGDGFMARDLTFANKGGPKVHQAVAFRSDSDLSVLDSVEFLGHQDTLYAHTLRQFYTNCKISGTVDFIFGNSASIFHNCSIFVLPRQDPAVRTTKKVANKVTAHGRTDPAQSTGFVFQNCVIDGSDDYLALYKQNQTKYQAYLGRPWKEYSRTVFINCLMKQIIQPEGWLQWDSDFALKTLFYGEYGSTGPGGDVTKRVSWSSQIPKEHVGTYSVENFIQGDQWIPKAGGK
ncbi:Pectinesterase/pectinesterase inhibitor [Rhynchospora pubera]|uniref:Pectinesterase n=1 Tax=Rhynchospora pubera TaxID=906938 RepID=A0AAV8CUS3_9POAL|nr:Pectinesterase/pectinesterase inhibitor [Rhynchospora pubera]